MNKALPLFDMALVCLSVFLWYFVAPFKINLFYLFYLFQHTAALKGYCRRGGSKYKICKITQAALNMRINS